MQLDPTWIVVGAVVLVPVIYTIATYNSLVTLRNQIRESWSNVDTELKRRYDLIPNLVEIVKGYAAHEKEVLIRVTQLRTQCMASNGRPEQQAVDENQLVEALKRLYAVVESYPDLKANQGFLKLQHEMVNTEDRIQAARRFFNGNVRDYKTKCQSFPSLLVAKAFSFPPEEYFTVEPAVASAPAVGFAATAADRRPS